LSPQERDGLVGLFGPSASSLVWGTPDQETYERANVGWLCYGMVIFEAPHHEPRSLNTVYSAVSQQGEIVVRPDGGEACRCLANGVRRRELEPADDANDGTHSEN
jgi:hypothetical protein